MNDSNDSNMRRWPEGWQLIRLENLIKEAQPGFACGERTENGVIQLRMNNVDTNGNMIWKNFIRVPANEGKISRYRLKTDDVLFNNTNSTELVGKTALFSGHTEDVVYSNHFTRLRVDMDKLDPEYLASWLNHLWASKIFEGICNRWIGQSAVKIDKLLNLEIPLPLLSEQKRIVAILNSHKSAIKQARPAAEAQLKAAKDLHEAYLRMVFASQEATEWPKKRLGQISRLISGGTPSRSKPEYFVGNLPWVKTLDLNCAVVEKTEECISDDAFAAIRGEMLPVGTVMVAMYGGEGTIGKSGILGLEAITNQAICSILPNPEVFVPEFLHYWLILIRAEWMKHSSGNRRDPNINKNIVAQMDCPMPPISKQKQIAAYLSEKMTQADKLQGTLEVQLRSINEMPASMLRQAFSGDL